MESLGDDLQPLVKTVFYLVASVAVPMIAAFIRELVRLTADFASRVKDLESSVKDLSGKFDDLSRNLNGLTKGFQANTIETVKLAERAMDFERRITRIEKQQISRREING